MSRNGFNRTDGMGAHLETTKPHQRGTGWILGKATHGDTVRGKMRAKEDAELLCVCGNKALSKQLRGKLPPIGYCRKCKAERGQ